MGVFSNTFSKTGRGKQSEINLSSLQNRMTFWASEISNINLVNKVGSGGILKDFPCAEIGDAGISPLTHAEFGMTDPTAIYEFYLETIISSVNEASWKEILSNGATTESEPGFMLRIYNNQINIRVGDGVARQNISVTGVFFSVGINRITLRFNLPTKEVYLRVNDDEFTTTHTLSNQISSAGLRIGSGSASKHQKLTYFLMKKNSTVIKEFIFTYSPYVNSCYVYYDTAGSTNYFRSVLPSSTQDLINPFKNGYDLYLQRRNVDVDDYRVVPKGIYFDDSVLDPLEYDLFTTITSNILGYYTCNYIEMPNLPIFDITNRTYWKSSIESDPFYLGGTAGKERWFHKSWLDFTWLNAHIESNYKYLVFIKKLTKESASSDSVITAINDIVLFSESGIYSQSSHDANSIIDLSNVYFYYLPNNTTQKLMHSLGDKRVILEGNLIKYSSNNGLTYSSGYDITALYPVADLSQIRILSNENIILFSRKTGIHYSSDNCVTFSSCTVLDSNGDPYVFHTPVNATYPGSYFNCMNGFVENNNIAVLGNYTNSGYGASPVNLYYTLDGITWKVFYTFGQSPSFTDIGEAIGGIGGTPLGDATNPLITRHVHGVNIGEDGNFYVCTGDNPRTPSLGEMHFLKCVYNSTFDSWTVTDLLNENTTNWQRMRAIGVFEKDGYIIWGSDGVVSFTYNDVTYQSPGIYKAMLADINDPSKHILLQSLAVSCYTFLNAGSRVITGLQSGHSVYMSDDYGETFTEYTTPNNFNTTVRDVFYNSHKFAVSNYKDIFGFED